MSNRSLFLVFITVLLSAAAGCVHHKTVVVPPPRPENFYAEGLREFHLGTPEAYGYAADSFRKAQALRPGSCQYSLNLVQSLLFLAAEQLSNWEEYEPRQTEAKNVLDSVADTCSVSYGPFVLRLRALIAGRGPATTEWITRAIEIDPNDAMNWLVLGYLDPTNSHLVTDEGTGKWVAMAHAAELYPNSALIQYELAKSYQSVRGKEDTARNAFNRAIEKSPQHYRSYLGLAYSADDSVGVVPLYEKVVSMAPDFLEGRTALGSYYAAVDEFEKAAEQYTAALASRPNYDIAHFRLGLLMLQAERPDDAERYFNAVVQLNPGSYEAFYYLGNIAYGHDDFQKAKREYEQALTIRANYAEAEYGLGRAYQSQNRPDLALAQFDKVIKIQPRYGDAYLSRGDIRAESQHLTEALLDYIKAIEIYEEQIKTLTAVIANADLHPQSPLAQAEKKRDERERMRLVVLVERAREYKLKTEQGLQLVP